MIHTTSWVDQSAKIEEGCVIYPKCVIDKNVIIKYKTILNLNCTIDYDTTIGAGTVAVKSIIKKGVYVGNPAKFIK